MQAGLHISCWGTPEDRFSCVEAHLISIDNPSNILTLVMLNIFMYCTIYTPSILSCEPAAFNDEHVFTGWKTVDPDQMASSEAN